MRIRLRLSKDKDKDLIAIYKCPGFNAKEEFTNALKAFFTGKSYTVRIPENIETKHVEEQMQLSVTLPDELADKIRAIKNGNLNMVLIYIIRNSLETAFIDPFCEEQTKTEKKKRGRKPGFHPLPVKKKPEIPALREAYFTPTPDEIVEDEEDVSGTDDFDVFSASLELLGQMGIGNPHDQ